MTGVIKVNELQGRTTANDITVTVGASATQSLHDGVAKSFVTYTQIYTTLNKSLNASSVSDDATGRFTITFTNAFTDFRYCKAGTSDGGSGTQSVICTYNDGSSTYRATGTNTIGVRNLSDNALVDRSFNTVMYLGDLA